MKKLKNLVYISLGIGAIATVLRVLGVIFAFDAEVEYFDVTSPINVASSALIAVMIVLCAAVGFAFRKRLVRDKKFFKKLELVSFLLGAVLLGYGVFELYRLFMLKNVLRTNQLAWSAVGVLLSFVAAVYFLGSFISSAKRGTHSMLLGFGFVFWCAYVMAVNYFDVYTTLNNPLKLSLQFALIAAMLCLICEFRIHFENESRSQHLAASLIGAVLCAYSSVPTVLCYVLGKTENVRYLFVAIACLAICAYTLRTALLFSEGQEQTDTSDSTDEKTVAENTEDKTPEVENDG